MIISSSIHFPAHDMISFFCMTEYYSIVYVYLIFIIHSKLAILNSAAINMGMQMSVLYILRYMPKSSMVTSYVSFTFNFWKNLHTDFHSSCTNLHFQQQRTRGLFSCILKSIYCVWVLSLFIYLGSSGVWTLSLTLPWQVLYHLSHSASPILCWVFSR
jgi:hypothetical protein